MVIIDGNSTFSEILAGTLRNSGERAKVVNSLTASKRGLDATVQACLFSCVSALSNICMVAGCRY